MAYETLLVEPADGYAVVTLNRPPANTISAQLVADLETAVDALARKVEGLLVWSSNRTGNHELYLLDLRTRSVRQLTKTPQVEFFSRFSPDGRRILFSRSQRDYVSPRDPTAWDVYVINVDGTGERLLARKGYSPQWTPDGNGIIFLRGDQVLRLDLVGGEAGRESVLLDGPTTEGIAGGMETPELSPDGTRLAVTVRSRQYGGVAVVDLATRAVTRLSPRQACQITWMRGSDALLWMEPQGNAPLGLTRHRDPQLKRRVLEALMRPFVRQRSRQLRRHGRGRYHGVFSENCKHPSRFSREQGLDRSRQFHGV